MGGVELGIQTEGGVVARRIDEQNLEESQMWIEGEKGIIGEQRGGWTRKGAQELVNSNHGSWVMNRSDACRNLTIRKRNWREYHGGLGGKGRGRSYAGTGNDTTFVGGWGRESAGVHLSKLRGEWGSNE